MKSLLKKIVKKLIIKKTEKEMQIILGKKLSQDFLKL